MIHFDTNFMIHASQPGHQAQVQLAQWTAAGEAFAVSAMAWAEFLCGPITPAVRQSWEQLVGAAVVPIDSVLSSDGAELFNRTGRRVRSLPDCIIAACAIRSSAALATFNLADFQPFVPHGLTLI